MTRGAHWPWVRAGHDEVVLYTLVLVSAAPFLNPAVLAGVPQQRAFGLGASAAVLVAVFVGAFAVMVFVGSVREKRRRRRR